MSSARSERLGPPVTPLSSVDPTELGRDPRWRTLPTVLTLTAALAWLVVAAIGWWLW